MPVNDFETMYVTWLQAKKDMTNVNRSMDYGFSMQFFRYLESTKQLSYILKTYGDSLIDFLVKYKRVSFSVVSTYGWRMCDVLDKRYKDVLGAIGNVYHLYLFFKQFKTLTKKHADDIFDFYAGKNWDFDLFRSAKVTRELVEENFGKVVNHYRSLKPCKNETFKGGFEQLLACLSKKILFDFRKELLLCFMDHKWGLTVLCALIPELSNEYRNLIVEYCKKNNFYLSFRLRSAT